MRKICIFIFLLMAGCLSAYPQNKSDEKAEAVIKKSIEKLGGEKYLGVKTIVGKGLFTILREGDVNLPASFIDILSFPDRERTEFKSAGEKRVQVNVGDKGWLFESANNMITDQKPKSIEGFLKGMKVSLYNLLRGYWRGKGSISYAGKREASLGKRNEVIKLTYDDGFTVEFEFSASDGLPAKAIFKDINQDGEESKEEDRYAQFVDIQGVMMPFIIDHFSNDRHTTRVNYDSIEINKAVPDSVFAKPTNPKELKKDIKL